MIKKIIAVLIVIFLLVGTIGLLSADDETYYACGGDDQTIIVCSFGDTETNSISNYSQPKTGASGGSQVDRIEKLSGAELLSYGILLLIILIIIIFLCWLIIIFCKRKKDKNKKQKPF